MMKHKTAYLGLFLALALICSYIESLIPFYFGDTGDKVRTDEYRCRLDALYDRCKRGISDLGIKDTDRRIFIWKSI